MIEIPKKDNTIASIFDTMATPFQKFAQLESASGILLILVTFIAMTWANMYPESYHHFIELPIAISAASFHFELTLHQWVNDALMVIFFYVVGMEIKRELLEGELSSPKKAALPIFAAIGGMVAPALIYMMFNVTNPETSHGWAIPMATDIAFAVGVLVLLGRRAPLALMVFLLALAIVDDLGAVVIIASFYTENVNPSALGMAFVGLSLIWALRFAGVKFRAFYFVISVAVWAAVLKSGVHPTVSGVVLGFLTPLGALVPNTLLKKKAPELLEDINEEKLQALQELVDHTQSPLEKNVELLHPWVNFLIMPIFALVNAGIILQGVDLGAVFNHEVTLGVMLGLLLGKPLGILAFCFAACKMGIAELPKSVNWLQITGVGCLAGIGFTMALFVSHLSFKVPGFETYSKVGILSGSALSAIVGSIILLIVSSRMKSKS